MKRIYNRSFPSLTASAGCYRDYAKLWKIAVSHAIQLLPGFVPPPSTLHPPPSTMIPIIDKVRQNWLQRHQNSFSFWIHMIGIPMSIVGLAMIFLVPWYWGVIAIVFGYVLQYVGHRVEGNDMGEWVAIKRLFGMPYVAIARRATYRKTRLHPRRHPIDVRPGRGPTAGREGAYQRSLGGTFGRGHA